MYIFFLILRICPSGTWNFEEKSIVRSSFLKNQAVCLLMISDKWKNALVDEPAAHRKYLFFEKSQRTPLPPDGF